MSVTMRFGDAERFEISARWLDDHEPRERLPDEYGWSLGEISIVVGGHLVTRHRLHGESKECIGWYLGPILSWLLEQWPWLLHEEAFAWPDKSGEAAASATLTALSRYIASDDALERTHYRQVQEWRNRHALRAADPSALYPDVYLRRVEDDVEVSWLERQPDYPPSDFSLDLVSGSALLPVALVAEALWSFIEWGLLHARPVTVSDRAEVAALQQRFDALKTMPPVELESLHIADSSLRRIISTVREGTGWRSNTKVSAIVPVVTELDSAVLMFGGLDVTIGEADAASLIRFLAVHQGSERDVLSRIVAPAKLSNALKPYIQGYELARDAREILGVDHKQLYVDMDEVLGSLGVSVHRYALKTDGIRGVAIAGEGFSPAVLINTTSVYNDTKRGERFTLAHELCHILHDRTRARRLSHISGPWASASVEKRANAFAVMFLASLPALRDAWGASACTKDSIAELADQVGMSQGALLDHLHNVDLISHEEFVRLGGASRLH